METSKKRAVIYCRVSTGRQVDEGNSLPTQVKFCSEYAQKNDFEVVFTYVEKGESAKNADRSELKKMLAFCTTKKNRIDAVIAYKIDRISRNTDDYSQIRMLLRKYNIEIKSTSEAFEDTPAGRFMENMLANVAQFDNDVRAERCSSGMQEALQEGRYVFRAPFGYSNVQIKNKSTIVPNVNSVYIRRAFEMVAKDIYPVETVRQQLIQQGMRSKGKPFNKAPFYALLRNTVYAGHTFKFGKWYQGTYTPIIAPGLFQTVQLLLSGKNKKPRIFKVNHEDFPLRRFIKHSSGKLLTGAWSKGRHKKYPYYFFHSLKISYTKQELEEKFKSLLNEFKLSSEQYERLLFLFNHHNADALENKKVAAENVAYKVDQLKSKKKSIIEKNLQGLFNDEFCKELLDEVDVKIYELDNQLKLINIKLDEDVKYLTTVKKVLLEPSKIWEDAPLNLKIFLQWFYFPEGIQIDTLESRTPKMACIYKLKTEILSTFYANVHHRNSTSNHQEISSQLPSENTLQTKDETLLQNIKEELSKLSEMITMLEVKNSLTI